MRKLLMITFAALPAVVFSACGQTGPLQLPGAASAKHGGNAPLENQSPKSAAPAAPAAPAQTTAPTAPAPPSSVSPTTTPAPQ